MLDGTKRFYDNSKSDRAEGRKRDQSSRAALEIQTMWAHEGVAKGAQRRQRGNLRASVKEIDVHHNHITPDCIPDSSN